jgi:hypothetical protein
VLPSDDGLSPAEGELRVADAEVVVVVAVVGVAVVVAAAEPDVAAMVVVVDDPLVVPGGVVVVVVEPPVAVVNLIVTGSSLNETLSDVSAAVYVTDSATVSVTMNVALPVSSVVPFSAVTVELPPDDVSVTVLPATALPFPS